MYILWAEVNYLWLLKILEKYIKIYTHTGDDLDNKSSVYAVSLWAKEMGIIEEIAELVVEIVKPGSVKAQGINLDTKGHKGNSFEEDPESILGGSQIAYYLGCDYFVSVEGKEEGKCTFAMTAKHGNQLPKSVQCLGERLIEQYKRKDASSGVFLNSKKDMLIACGFKNPTFRVDTSAEKNGRIIKRINANWW